MRLTRTLEERLVALYRQTKVVGGLFRSLGQEADAVGSAASRSSSATSCRRSSATWAPCS
jgi:TPP-dependent pyruvate/acetoin dehydrogenase alpha subunit